MKPFLSKDFLLSNPTAVELYHEHAAKMPIIDYHCHLDPQQIYEDVRFENITQVWLGGDHYKWRIMRSNGVDEYYITGDAPDREKFQKFAEALPRAIGNPMYHWCHLELKNFFGYEGTLNGNTAEEVWNLCNAKLAESSFSARGLIKMSNVAMIGTTDDPCSDLQWHQKLAKEGFETKVCPSFRPDPALNCHKAGFAAYIQKLSDASGIKIEHATDVAKALTQRIDYFNECGIPAMALVGQSSDEDRRTARERLVKGELRIIFVVDIYNEGVDIPEVNTVLFLRPTESLTIFLQQLGRGLRLAEGKECLTVLDFIGAANRKYNFEEKFTALLSGTRRSVEQELRHGFVNVPKGCYIQLEKKAAKYILDNIRASYGNTVGLVSRVATFAEDSGMELTLANFLDYYHLDPRAIYKFSSFSRICARADVIEDFEEPLEETLTKAFARLAVIDSRRWISFLLDILPRLDDVDFDALSDVEKRMLQMFYITIWGKAVEDWGSEEVLDNLYALSDSSTLIGELISLLQYRYEQIDFIDEPVDLGFDCPLDLHCTYTRDQLLVAMDFMKPATVREGVKWLPEKQLDVFFVTLNKSDKDYSPTTMYNDYSINETLFHWQSQSTTAADSPTGQRYIKHRSKGTKVLLFVREFKSDRITNGAEAYTYLGTANYVTHSGSKPMNITWKLDRPIPAKFLKKTNKLVVG